VDDDEEVDAAGPEELAKPDELVALHGVTTQLFELTSKEDMAPADREAIDLLSLLIQTYEGQQYPVPQASPQAVLRFLMNRHNLQLRDLEGEIGSVSIVSLILAGKRSLTVRHIRALLEAVEVWPL